VIKKIIVFAVVLSAAAHGYAQTVHRDNTVFIESKPMVGYSRNESQQDYEDKRSGKSSKAMFSIFGGAALPLGDFARTEDNLNDGFAKTGWSAGAQFVSGGSAGLIIEGSYSRNKIEPPSISASTPGTLEYTDWTLILALAGLKIGTDNAEGTNFFIAPLVGTLFGKSPEYKFTPAGIGAVTLTEPSASCSAFAYGLAVEAILSGHFTVSAQYIASKPKFKYTVNGNDYESDPRNIAFALVTLGIAF
jgi:hypothetical protein